MECDFIKGLVEIGRQTDVQGLLVTISPTDDPRQFYVRVKVRDEKPKNKRVRHRRLGKSVDKPGEPS
jgi:hypothetical protein